MANNSSGMACGTEFNTYRTIESMVLVLASGTVLDTAAPDAEQKLRTLEPELFEGLLRLRGRIVANPHSVATIEHLFSMKNTMGYGLNSFLDFERPVDILTHLRPRVVLRVLAAEAVVAAPPREAPGGQ